MRTAKSGFTIRELQQALSAIPRLKQCDLRDAVEQLEANGVLDYEQGRSDIKTYFLPTQPPRPRVVRVSAASVPPLHMAPRTWLSSLAVAA
jgi:hypothetical protein